VVNGDHGEWICEIRRRWKVIRVVRVQRRLKICEEYQ
jgi:hypothetical protein